MQKVKWFFERYPETQLPIFFLAIYMLFFFTAGQFLFQNTGYIMEQIRVLYQEYGLALIFLGGFLETFFMLGIYLPGSLTIALGIIVDPTIYGVFWVSVMCVSSAFVANILNFMIGKYGLTKFFNFLGAKHVLQAQENKRNSDWGILLSSVNPNLLGIVVVYFASKGMNFFKLISLSLLSTIFWVPILACVVLVFGEKILQSNSVYVFLMLFVAWIVYLILAQEVKYYLDKRKVAKSVE